MRYRAPVTFVAVAVLWGVPYALIKVALEHGAAPLLIAWTRVAIGAAVLIAVAARRGKLRGLLRHPVALIGIAVCDVAGPFALLTFGEQRVSSSQAGILVATTPLFVGALAAAGGFSERPSRALTAARGPAGQAEGGERE